MFSRDHSNDQISKQGESKLIEQIRAWLGSVSPPSPQGIGDDCAVLHFDGKQIITTDTLTYEQHFDDLVSAEDAGAKLIKRNLSDVAAMGGTPQSAVLALLCGPNLSFEWLKGFFKGIRSSCERYEVTLVGGDVSGLKKGNFSAVLTLIGHCSRPVLRHSAQAGDRIYTTGHLGGSILKKHFSFEPRLIEGQWLAARSECSAMMDLTDGLAKDLRAMTPTGCCASLNLEKLPISKDAVTISGQTSKSPLEHAFTDGEDYELLFCISGETNRTDFENRWQAAFPKLQISCIGQFELTEANDGLLIDNKTRKELPWTHGFEHFSHK